MSDVFVPPNNKVDSIHIGYDFIILSFENGSMATLPLSDRCKREQKEKTEAFAKALRTDTEVTTTATDSPDTKLDTQKNVSDTIQEQL